MADSRDCWGKKQDFDRFFTKEIKNIIRFFLFLSLSV